MLYQLELRTNVLQGCAWLLAAVCLTSFTPTALAQSSDDPGQPNEGLSTDDWSSIRSAYQAGQHKAFPNAEGFQMRSPRQRWLAKFDGEGFLVQPDDGGWSWGLELEAYGFEGAMRTVSGEAQISAAANRVTHDWGSGVEEWYVNDRRGLEHGYTLASRPQRCTDESALLTFELAVRGSLKAEIIEGGRGVRFVDDKGATVVTYAGLLVVDADNIAASATFLGGGDHVQISIAEQGAKYPLTIDPIAQQAYLKASNTDTYDSFGVSLAISGDLVVVGAREEASNATGVNGDQSDNSAIRSGAAYVFERSGGIWTQQAYLKASNTGADDEFGTSVAISGNLLVVGAWQEESNTTGVNGNQSDNSATKSGAAYVFERSGGIWSQQAYLKASNTEPDDYFGSSVAISGDKVVVGARYEGSNATGVNGNQSDNSASKSGAAYVYERSGGIWSQQAYLKASNTDAYDFFGQVAMSGDLLVVGAWEEDSNATGINGDQTTNSSINSGAAYVFERSGGTWSQQAYLKASNPGNHDWFGVSVAISGDLLVVGAQGEDSNATGVNGNQSDNSASNSGAAYVFERAGGIWTQQAYLKASNTGDYDWFGASVAIAGELAVVGALGEDSNATGVNGNRSDNSASYSGAAYAFERSGGIWGHRAYLKASNTESDDHFGISVAVSGDLIVVGASYESSNSTGVNGNQSDNSTSRSGAAYIFDLASTTSGNYCGPAVPNSSGFSASMSMSGSAVVTGNNLTLEASNLPTHQFSYFLNSMGVDFLASFGGSQGHLCLGGGFPLGRHNRPFEVQNSGATGSISLTLDLTDMPSPSGSFAVLAGETWYFQCWFRDQNPNSTSNFTDGLWVQFE